MFLNTCLCSKKGLFFGIVRYFLECCKLIFAMNIICKTKYAIMEFLLHLVGPIESIHFFLNVEGSPQDLANASFPQKPRCDTNEHHYHDSRRVPHVSHDIHRSVSLCRSAVSRRPSIVRYFLAPLIVVVVAIRIDRWLRIHDYLDIFATKALYTKIGKYR